MKIFWELFFDLYPLVAAVVSMLLAQLLKIVYAYLQGGRIALKQVMVSGGMPSAHAALVAGLTTAVGLKEGWTSTLFCISAVFAMIVLYDASGVRRAVGQQTHVINQFIDEFFEKGEFKYDKLSAFLGHTPFEVLVGALLGVGVAFTLYY